jgi:hypothetical protein
MRVRRLLTPVLVTASVVALAATGAVPASAHTASAPTIETVNSTVLAPYHLSTSGGRLLVADGGTSLVSRVADDGSLTTLATGPQPGEVAGVAAGNNGFAYTWTDYTTGAAGLTIHLPGKPDVNADLSTFETQNNPNGNITYGILHRVNSCVRNALKAAEIPVRYKGDVNPHPYAVTYGGNGWWYVADAGGNDILAVSPTGDVSLVKVLPRQALHIDQAFADANGLPSCVVGLTYYTDPVPTGIRMFNGKLYVAELFGGQISTISNGHPVPVVTLPGVVSVSYGLGESLYAGIAGPTDDEGNPTGEPGSIVKITLH